MKIEVGHQPSPLLSLLDLVDSLDGVLADLADGRDLPGSGTADGREDLIDAVRIVRERLAWIAGRS